MVVDAIICHWVTLVSGEEAGLEGFGWAIQWIAEFFYVDYGLLDSHCPALLQAALYVLAGLFNCLDLQTNINKTVGMVFQPFQILDGHSEAA